MPCYACGKNGPSDPHHLQTIGAGGGDELTNLIALCRAHHGIIHLIGVRDFALKYDLPVLWEGNKPVLDIKNPKIRLPDVE